MQLSVDRIENGNAVLIGRDDGTVRLTLPATGLPAGTREGDILTLVLERNEEATRLAKERSASLIEKLRKKT